MGLDGKKDDDFYGSLAASASMASDNESDMSDADLSEMRKNLEVDDDDLFGTLGAKKKPSSANGKTADKDNQQESTLSATFPGTKRVTFNEEVSVKPLEKSARSTMAAHEPKKTDDDFDDLLADILLDDDDKPKTKTAPVKPRPAAAKPEEPVEKHPPSSEGRPGTSRGRAKNEFDSDDGDDLLDDLGLDEKPKATPSKKRVTEDDDAKAGKAFVNDLFSQPSVERPGSKGAEVKQEPEKESGFEGYMPSAASRTAARRRSLSDEHAIRPATAPAESGSTKTDSKANTSWLGTSDDDGVDWLGLTAPRKQPVKAAKPKERPAAETHPVHVAAPTSDLEAMFESQADRALGKSPMGARVKDDDDSDLLDFLKDTPKAPASRRGGRPAGRVDQPSPQPASGGQGSRPPTAPVTGDGIPHMQNIQIELQSQSLRQTDGNWSFQPVARPVADHHAAPVWMSQPEAPKSQVAYISANPSDNQTMALIAQIKKLEFEKSQLEMTIHHLKKRHEEELAMLESSSKGRTEFLEESSQRKEKRLKEENESLTEHYRLKMQESENERQRLAESHHLRVVELDQNQRREIERIQELHRKAIEQLKKDHDWSLQRIRTLKDHETEAVQAVSYYPMKLNDVIGQIESSTKNLGDLQSKIEQDHSHSVEERTSYHRTRDEQMRQLQERLIQQQKENELERNRLKDVINRLESHLQEHERQLEEERWKNTRERNQLETMMRSLEEDKRALEEKVGQERLSIQKAKDALLKEQQMIVNQLMEERRALGEERAEVAASQNILFQKQLNVSVRTSQIEGEAQGTLKKAQDELAFVNSKKEEIRVLEMRFINEKENLEKEKERIDKERRKLEEVSIQLKERLAEVERMAQKVGHNKKEAQNYWEEARRTEAEQNDRLKQIEARLNVLREREMQFAKEKSASQKSQRPTVFPARAKRSRSDSVGNLLGAHWSSRTNSEWNLTPTIALLRVESEKDKQLLEEERKFLATIHRMRSPVHNVTF